jgi:tRNA (cytosine38-C5)-methyltransferase
LHTALKRTGKGRVVRAFDWDQVACRVYEANHGKGIVQRVDISTLTVHNFASLNAKLWLLSPACQPYTVLNPNAKGGMDPRALSFLHLIQVVLPGLVSQQTQPSHLLIENVAGFAASVYSIVECTVSDER